MKKSLLGICGLGLALSLVACGDDVNFKDPVSVQKFLAKSDPQGVRKALENNRNAQFDENKQYIKDGIKRELLTAFINDSVSTAFSLKQDKQLNEAIKYLSDMNLYKKAISAPDKRAKKNTNKDSKKK